VPEHSSEAALARPTEISIRRLPNILRRFGKSRSTLYRDIESGLFPRPIKLGARAIGWPLHEIDAVIKATVEGASSEELRDLVRTLVAARSARQAA
jgi:prophage regulatory protein